MEEVKMVARVREEQEEAEAEVGRRCKLDPGLKAPPGFKGST